MKAKDRDGSGNDSKMDCVGHCPMAPSEPFKKNVTVGAGTQNEEYESREYSLFQREAVQEMRKQ